MDSAEASATGVCFQCGGGVTAAQRSCSFCGMPVLPEMLGAPRESSPPPGIGAAPLPQPTLTLGTASHERRIGRKPVLIAVAAAAALVLVATGIAVVSRLTADTPKSTVQDYFDALGDGDAARALQLVSRGDEVDTAKYPLLTDAALADRAARPSEVEVGDATEDNTMYGEDASTVPVTYHALGTTVQLKVPVVKAAKGDGYQLVAPLVQLSLKGVAGRAVTVNGIALSAASQDEVIAFPGGYQAQAGGTALLAPASVTALPVDSGFGWESELDFGDPQLAPDAHEKIASAVRSSIDRCAASTEAAPAGCPFSTYVGGSDVSVRWSITTYPAITEDASSIAWLGTGDQVPISDDGTGSAHWTATYTDYSGARQTESGDTSFRIYGYAQATGSDIRVALN
ncbi:hypothetical protein GCM10010168_89090 [Actinoplanes ianthinogenes]|uniref:Zinc ribbon domain-containing protein n=1 Tax=Actinoplanes ianthinogenes TaxID=122358 RepID=A0ABM7LQ04_9ACTN|nr:hypothetical protein [Actinoplanes ianthinogenes]BCJ41331.1 hypothetical protein Aiant_19880 [Actinoplanes ianthinogenes]GGR56359.1 hypothetical protein GCM10010168_89090 [Actinoplanes ianthinogenes]